MDALRDQPGVMFVPIEQVLAAARADLRTGDVPQARAIYRYLDGYYFESGGARAAAAASEFQGLLRAKEGGGAGVSPTAR